eukprot:GFKZ01013622.1.p1 GENE.GFKZ01013622.1~~GFKZ01013622.1.p1  ORF type:complete len:432 (-),score=70.87 GFKZ01013622.1:377-1672(-)
MALATPLLLVLLALILAPAPSQAASTDVLVVVDDDTIAETHSTFLSTVSSLNRTMHVKPAASTSSIPLVSDGEYLYGTVILLCPTAAKMDRRLPLASLLRFLDAGNNLFAVSAHGYSDYMSKVVEAMGVDLDNKHHRVIDHQHVAELLDDGSRTFVHAGGVVESEYLFGEGKIAGGDVVFSGPGATLFKDNELVDAVVWGSGSAYSVGGDKAMVRVPRAVGSGCVFGAAVGMRTGGRAGYWGSLEALGNEAMGKYERHGTGMRSFLGWSMGEGGKLRVGRRRWEVLDADGRMEVRVGDVVRFEVEVEEMVGGEWRAWEGGDMQVELGMLNVWARKRLVKAEGSWMRAEILVPDRIGVYSFRVEYWRVGMGAVSLREEVPVRPFLHNEYERFIGMAGPYYAGAFSMLVGVWLMSLVVLWGGDGDASGKSKEE